MPGGHLGWGANELQRKTFVNARYAVSEQELTDDDPDAMSARFVRPMAAVARPISDGEEVFPGVRALATSDQTPGHTAYVIETGTDVSQPGPDKPPGVERGRRP